MKKLSVITVVVFLAFTVGCTSSKPDPQPTSTYSSPSPSVVQPSEPPVSDEPTPDETTEVPGNGSESDSEPTKNPDPSPTPTSEEPPATKFLKRWGLSFPKVEEASIMGAGAKTCERLKDAPDNWETNNQFIIAVKADMESAGFGEVSSATAASFALDASQNLCSVVS